MNRGAARSGLGPELAADAAHAARGPFSAALPALDMLRSGLMGDLTAGQRDALSTVERAVRRAFDDSGDLAALLAAMCDRIEPRPAATPVAALLSDALAQAGLGASLPVRVTIRPGVPPVLVDAGLTAGLLAVLVRRCAGVRDRDDTGRPFDDQSAPDEQVVRLSLEARSEAGAPAGVSITCGRGEAPHRELTATADAAAVESEPESAPLVLTGALLVAQGGWLRATRGAATVWLPAAPVSG